MATWAGTVSMHQGAGPALGTSQDFACEAADQAAAEAAVRAAWEAAGKPIDWADMASMGLRGLTAVVDVHEA